MNLVTLKAVSIERGERQLLDEIDLLVNEGDRIGLIGANGSGKTTLLRVIGGLEQPDSGTVTIWGGVRIAFLPQDPQVVGDQSILGYMFEGSSPQLNLLRNYRAAIERVMEKPEDPLRQKKLAELTDEMDRTNGWAAEAEARAILTRLGLSDLSVPLNTLSGGQGKRAALARTLFEPADLLILDEPTNHIDALAVDWLESYLKEIPRALIIVTHDRYFLDRVANRIYELDRRQLTAYPGSYQKYLELRSSQQDQLAEADRKKRMMLRKELEWLRRSPMARGTKQKARKTRIDELQRVRQDLGQDTISMALAGKRLGKKVLEANSLDKSFGEIALFQSLNLSLERGARLGIVGPNGSGKSTLLDILAGIGQPDTGLVEWGQTVELAYYDQLSRGLEQEKKVIDFINDKAPLIKNSSGRRIEAAQMLEWFLFPRPQQQAYIHSLSGGEQRRLYLLWVLIHQPNVLFLDEPTNDLDIPTLRVLEQFLDNFTGTLIVVSHDRFFLDRNVDFLARLSGGKFDGPFPGPFDSFQSELEAGRISPKPRKAGKIPDPVEESPADKAGLSWKERRELEALESEIEALERQKRSLEEDINRAGGSFEKLSALTKDLETVDNRLQWTMERWLVLAARSEG